jgi:hypothetical protein
MIHRQPDGSDKKYDKKAASRTIIRSGPAFSLPAGGSSSSRVSNVNVEKSVVSPESELAKSLSILRRFRR